MSTLSKVFVILVFIVSLVWTGVVATLFAQRTDWKDKYVKEVHYHYLTQNTKNAEIAAARVELQNTQAYVTILRQKNDDLRGELTSSNDMKMAVQKQLDISNRNLKRLESELDAQVMQLEVQNSQIQAATKQLNDVRSKLAMAQRNKTIAIAELNSARQNMEIVEHQLAELETNYVDQARVKRALEEKLARLTMMGYRTEVAPLKPLEGAVTAVDHTIGLVVISIGKNNEVKLGDEFTVYRSGAMQSGEFVAKIVIDQADAEWASGRITLRKSDPRVGDNVSNRVMVAGSSAPDDR